MRAWLSPSSLRARPREASPSPQPRSQLPAPPAGPSSPSTTQPNRRPPLGRSDWRGTPREAELSLSVPRLPNGSANWKFRSHRGPGLGVDWLPRRSLRKLLLGTLARLVEAADPDPPFPGNHVVEAGPGARARGSSQALADQGRRRGGRAQGVVCRTPGGESCLAFSQSHIPTSVRHTFNSRWRPPRWPALSPRSFCFSLGELSKYEQEGVVVGTASWG